MHLSHVRSVLCVRPDAIGDVMLITPAIRMLKQLHPDWQIDVLAREYTRELFDGNADIRQVRIDPYYTGGVKGLRAYWQYVQLWRSWRYDLVIHFYQELPYVAAAWLAGVPLRLGDRSKIFMAWMNNVPARQTWRNLTKHEVEHNLDLLKALGYQHGYAPMVLKAKSDLRERMRTRLGQLGWQPGQKLVGIHLSSGGGNKAWHTAGYAQVITQLLAAHHKVVLTGQDQDREAEQSLLAQFGSSVSSLVSQTSLPELIALISLYDCYVGVDTGPFHLASALGISIAAIFPTKNVKPLHWGPWFTKYLLVRDQTSCPLACVPRHCPLDTCLKDQSPDSVVQAIETLLAAGGQLRQPGFDFYLLARSSRVLFVVPDDATAKYVQPLLLKLRHEQFPYSIFNLASQPRTLKAVIEILVRDDINIIHNLCESGGWFWILASYVSALRLPIPPLYVDFKMDATVSPASLGETYWQRFQELTFI